MSELLTYPAAAAAVKAKDDADVLDSWEEALDEDGNVKESLHQETEEEAESGTAATKKQGIAPESVRENNRLPRNSQWSR